MTKLLCAITVSALLVFSGGSVSTTSKVIPTDSGSVSQASELDPICHLPVANLTIATSVSSLIADVAQEQEGSTHCERPSKDNPDVGGKDKNKLGCMCIYKCVNGKPEEDNSNSEARCKNFCKKEQCECTKPSCES